MEKLDSQTTEKSGGRNLLEKYRLVLAIGVLAIAFFSGLTQKLQDAISSRVRGEATKAELIQTVEGLTAKSKAQEASLDEINKTLSQLQAQDGGTSVQQKVMAEDVTAIRERIRIIETDLARFTGQATENKAAINQLSKNDDTHTQTIAALIMGAMLKPPPATPTPTPKPTPTPVPCKPGIFKKC